MTTKDDAAPTPGQEETVSATNRRRAVGDGVPMPVYLQPARIETILPGYPAEARPSIEWLARYCRERCSSSHKILAAHSTQAGNSRSFAYFYSLFKGDHDMAGAEALSGFLQMTASLRAYDAKLHIDDERLFFPSVAFEEFERAVNARCKSHVKHRLVLVAGPTGSGKTELFRELIARQKSPALKDRLNIALVDSAQSASFYDWLPILCEAVGVRAAGRQELKAEQIISNARQFDVILIDDAHRLYRESAGSNQTCWNFIQRLLDKTKCVIGVSVTDVFADDIEEVPYFHQFAGRMAGRDKLIRLPAFPEDDDIVGICQAYGLQHARRCLGDVQYAAHGYERLRPLQDALAFARARSGDSFTLNDLAPFLPLKPSGQTAAQRKAKKS
jgi:hypothetical protein